MEKDKKIKIFLGLAYLLIVILFLWLIFNKFTFEELTSYDFIKNNRDYLISLKESNLFLISLTFFIFTILWVLLLGFGSPIFLLGGFIFGKWIGSILVVFGLSRDNLQKFYIMTCKGNDFKNLTFFAARRQILKNGE